MRPRISIIGPVRPSVRPSVRDGLEKTQLNAKSLVSLLVIVIRQSDWADAEKIMTKPLLASSSPPLVRKKAKHGKCKNANK